MPIGSTQGLEAGAVGQRLKRFIPPRAHVNSLIAASGSTVLARARYLARNNAYAGNAIDFFASQVVGTGIVPSWKGMADRPDLKKALADAWLAWTDESDADGQSDLYGQQRAAAKELFIANEVFIRMRLRRPDDGLLVPLQLQMLPSEMLPINDNRSLGNGNVVRQGVEFDQIGRRVAYWFWRQHPEDYTVPQSRGDAGRQTRVPADQVLHIMDGTEAGQIRGLTRMARGIVPLWLLDLYDDAELDRKRTAALFAVFRKMQAEFEPSSHGAEDNGDGTAEQELAPGAQIILQPGEDISVAAPADVGGSYEAFQYRNLLRAAAALNIPYVGLTGDMVRANYSNLRGALIDFRRRASTFQHSVLVFQMCRPIVKAWLPLAVMSGAVRGLTPAGLVADRARVGRVAWTPPSWEWVDPAKDVKAAKDEVDAGFRSRSSVIEARGEDPDEVDAEIAAERAREQRNGLGETGSAFAGKAATAPAAPAPDPVEEEQPPENPEGPKDE
ncbi:phage portal protein [Roseomonas sp. HJA6]|uniref:Phage portal protein n=2 Tax=Roseomonas alba TaxID=2846776 RepID=A0ABS7AD55_9PROT|nr:phage portal protein [Neoroseomonas alba]MBW6399990.1 phage portal protein [Neoroseomonas alba]